MGLLTGNASPRFSNYTSDIFTGNGSTTTFSLSRSVGSSSSLLVTIDGVKQHSNTYSLGVSQIIFSEAPPSGATIECIAIGAQGSVMVVSDNTVTAAKIVNGSVNQQKLDVASANGSGAAIMPVGTSLERPSAPSDGMFRKNTSIGEPEWYDTTTSRWYRFSGNALSIDYLVVAGGGGGGFQVGGGGGAGGYISSSALLTVGLSYSVVVGAGGAGSVNSTTTAYNGSNSSFVVSGTVIAIGGGFGGCHNQPQSYPGSGGSGGGGSGNSASQNVPGAAGTAGQGNAGGTGLAGNWAGGGGGGASAVGGNASANTGGAGGAGKQWLDGNYYAGGGGGSMNNQTAAGYFSAGGIGGGGRGLADNGMVQLGINHGDDGVSNTGGGGGGVRDVYQPGSNYTRAGNGGSGVVVIRYIGNPAATGGNITSSNGYTYHTFTGSGTFTIL